MRRLLAVCLAFGLLAACGSGDEADDGATGTTAAQDLTVQVASYDLAVGPPTRVIAGVLTEDDRLVGFGSVQMRFGYAGTKEKPVASPSYGNPVEGAFLAIPGSELPQPAPSTPQVVTGSSVRGLYTTTSAFDRAGFWSLEVTANIDGKDMKGTSAFAVGERHAVPAPGDKALATENLTLASTDAPKGAIDSRGATGEITDPELHQTTIAAALAAHRPVVAVFATPVYCVSRFCGPVTDMVQQLAQSYGDRASFVHVEIWRDFQNKVVNKSAADWILRGEGILEPWVFVINSDGVITHRFDNVATREELEPILRQLPVVGPR